MEDMCKTSTSPAVQNNNYDFTHNQLSNITPLTYTQYIPLGTNVTCIHVYEWKRVMISLTENPRIISKSLGPPKKQTLLVT